MSERQRVFLYLLCMFLFIPFVAFVQLLHEYSADACNYICGVFSVVFLDFIILLMRNP